MSGHVVFIEAGFVELIRQFISSGGTFAEIEDLITAIKSNRTGDLNEQDGGVQ